MYENTEFLLSLKVQVGCIFTGQADSWQRWLDDMLASVLITINKGHNR